MQGLGSTEAGAEYLERMKRLAAQGHNMAGPVPGSGDSDAGYQAGKGRHTAAGKRSEARALREATGTKVTSPPAPKPVSRQAKAKTNPYRKSGGSQREAEQWKRWQRDNA